MKIKDNPKKINLVSDIVDNANGNDEDLSFQAKEAYNLLRTNLLFSMPNADKCYVIGVSSAMGGEGKSTTSKNLALSFADANKKVLLVEFDLRMPTLARKLGINKTPGMSNLIVGLTSKEEVIQKYPSMENMDVITAGDIPPNPSELLSSVNIQEILKDLSKDYNYIVMDLPPVNLVSDALVMSHLLDGIILVVRQNYNHRKDLNEALRRLRMVDAKIVGFVLNDSETETKKYKGKYKYKYKYENASGKKAKKSGK